MTARLPTGDSSPEIVRRALHARAVVFRQAAVAKDLRVLFMGPSTRGFNRRQPPACFAVWGDNCRSIGYSRLRKRPSVSWIDRPRVARFLARRYTCRKKAATIALFLNEVRLPQGLRFHDDRRPAIGDLPLARSGPRSPKSSGCSQLRPPSCFLYALRLPPAAAFFCANL